MKLISEALEDVKFLAEEDDNGKKNYKIKGIFMQGNIKNRNGRVYPTEVLEKEVKRYSDKFIENNRAYGELGHPEGPTVNLDSCLLYTSPSPRDRSLSRMPSAA